ncbi:MAG: FemAB family PEP-CTERM system-associated protein [Lentisphaerae bacterium]|nr:FemAB family PEP-CTERM system-associated protein [Lentisphaerota bacterium]
MKTSNNHTTGHIEICRLEPHDAARWDAFVHTCPDATFFHLSGWKMVLEQAFGHATHFLFAQRNGAIEGVLPLGHIRSLLFGNTLISSPFCVYGGVAATTADARSALTQAGVDLAEQLRVDSLEFRYRLPQNQDWPRKDLYVTFRKDIDADPDKNLAAIPRKQRAVIRKAMDSALTSVIDPDIDRFFAAYSASVRNLGTPVFARKYFRILKDVFGEACEVLTVEFEGRPIASVMSFYFRDEVLPYYGGGASEARTLKGNDFMYWQLMCHAAAERGCKIFDYGRSKQGTGSYDFKRHWGFEPQALHYEFHLVKAREIPEVNPLNPKYRYFIQAWQRLPLSVSQWIGPLISKNLG